MVKIWHMVLIVLDDQIAGIGGKENNGLPAEEGEKRHSSNMLVDDFGTLRFQTGEAVLHLL